MSHLHSILKDLPRASPALVSLLFELSFCEEGQSGTLTRLPQFVIDNFYVHMAVVELKLDSIVVGISDEESKLLWNIVLGNGGVLFFELLHILTWRRFRSKRLPTEFKTCRRPPALQPTHESQKCRVS